MNSTIIPPGAFVASLSSAAVAASTILLWYKNFHLAFIVNGQTLDYK